MAILIRLLRLLIVPFLVGWLIRSFRRDMARDGESRGGGFDWRRFTGSFGQGGPYSTWGNWSSSSGTGGSQRGGTSSGPTYQRPHSPWDVLGLPRSASDDDIKKRYRELVAQYHPDRFAGMADKDFSELAAKKFKALQEAYETLKRIKGF